MMNGDDWHKYEVNFDIIFVEEERCLLKLDDISGRRKIGSSKEDIVQKKCRPANSEKIFSKDTSLTLTPISTKLKKKEIGPT